MPANVPKRRPEERTAVTSGQQPRSWSQKLMLGIITSVDDSSDGDPKYRAAALDPVLQQQIAMTSSKRPHDRIESEADEAPTLRYIPRAVGNLCILRLPEDITSPNDVNANLEIFAAFEKVELTTCNAGARGPWTDGIEYVTNDIVTVGGSAYQATAAHTASNATRPESGSSWEDAWALLARGANNPVSGPTTSTTNAIPTWDATDGSLLADNPTVRIESGTLVADGTIQASDFAAIASILVGAGATILGDLSLAGDLNGRDPDGIARTLLVTPSGSSDSTGSAVVIGFDTSAHDDDVVGLWTVDAGNTDVDLNVAGDYRIDLEAQIDVATGVSAVGEVRLQLDTGGGYADISGTERSVTFGMATDSRHIATRWALTASAGDKIRAVVERTSGTGTVSIPAAGATLTISKSGD